MGFRESLAPHGNNSTAICAGASLNTTPTQTQTPTLSHIFTHSLTLTYYTHALTHIFTPFRIFSHTHSYTTLTHAHMHSTHSLSHIILSLFLSLNTHYELDHPDLLGCEEKEHEVTPPGQRQLQDKSEGDKQPTFIPSLFSD